VGGRTTHQGGRRLGKVDRHSMQAQLKQLETDYSIEWQDYRLGDLFEIQNTLSFNKDKLTQGKDYDYVTRTSQNQGILQQTGFVNKENINPAGTWSLGLLQMDFFYRQKPWYAGQFVRKIASKNGVSPNAIIYFTALFNRKKQSLLSVLVRDVDKIFLNAPVSLPTVTNNGEAQIAFDFMEAFIATLKAERLATLKAERLATLKAYLTVTGLTDTTLTPTEQSTLKNLDALTWKTFEVKQLFSIKNTHSILSRDIVPNSGKIPYLTAGQSNNSVGTHIQFDNAYIDEGNCIFIGGKTFVVTYQKDQFFSNDSHNLALYHKELDKRTKNNLLFMATSIYKSLSPLYSWGDSISNKKIQKDIMQLPITDDGTPDYDTMNLVVSALQKVVIQGVVSYLDDRIEKTGELV
jgi:hypothetical protein